MGDGIGRLDQVQESTSGRRWAILTDHLDIRVIAAFTIGLSLLAEAAVWVGIFRA